MDAHTPEGVADKGRSRWCHWHQGPSSTATYVRSQERQSGPPIALYACDPCREQRNLSPAVGLVEL